jgi:hypothetical protein
MTLVFLFNSEQGNLGNSTHQHVQVPSHYPGYYPVGNTFMPLPFGLFFGAPGHGQDTQQENFTRSFYANPYNYNIKFICMQQFILARN